MRKTKVLHLITSLGSGGAERVLYNLVTNSDSSKFEHIVVSIKGYGVYSDLLQNSGVKTYNLDVKKIKPWRLLKFLVVCRRENPDIIQSWLYHADFLTIFAYICGFRNIIWNIRNTNLEWSKSSKLTILLRKICACFSFIPKKIVCCANAAKAEHIMVGYLKNKFELIPNGYNLTLFVPRDDVRKQIRNKLNIGDHELVIGNIGRFDPAKDHKTLLRAIKKLKDCDLSFKLLIIGRNINHNNNELMSLITEYKLNQIVILLDQQPDIHLYYNAFDLYLLSSRTEAFPNVVAEAMLCCKPCIVTDVGDAALIVGDTGIIVPIGSHEVMAEAVMEFLDLDKTKFLQLGFKARKRIEENFSLKNMVFSYEKLYLKILEK